MTSPTVWILLGCGLLLAGCSDDLRGGSSPYVNDAVYGRQTGVNGATGAGQEEVEEDGTRAWRRW